MIARPNMVHLFDAHAGGAYRAPVEIGNIGDPLIRERLDDGDVP